MQRVDSFLALTVPRLHLFSEVTEALGPAAQLRLLSVAGCGLAALQRNRHDFAAHPYLRIQTHTAYVARGDAFSVGSDDDA